MANIYLTLCLSAWCLTPHKTMCLQRNVRNWKTWPLFFPANLYDHKILGTVHSLSSQTHRSTDEETEAGERGCCVQLSASGCNGLEVRSVAGFGGRQSGSRVCLQPQDSMASFWLYFVFYFFFFFIIKLSLHGFLLSFYKHMESFGT